MVDMIAHGGGCCGMRHIRSFGEGTNNNPDTINTAQSQVPEGRLSEIVLNDLQVQRYPRILERMANLGYVLVARFTNNNTGSICNVFHRADIRHPLTNERGECTVRNWNGPIISARLMGNLPEVTAAAPITPNNYEHYVRPLPAGVVRGPDLRNCNRPRVGERARVRSARSRYDGREGVIASEGFNDYMYINIDGVQDLVRILQTNLIRLDPPRVDESNQGRVLGVGVRVQWRGGTSGNLRNGTYGTVRTVHRDGYHATVNWDDPALNSAPWREGRDLYIPAPGNIVERIVPPPSPVNDTPAHQHPSPADDPRRAAPVPRAERAEPTIVFQTYHNVYRDGRRGAGYDTIEAAREARRGNGRVDCRRILSDGSTQWDENYGG